MTRRSRFLAFGILAFAICAALASGQTAGDGTPWGFTAERATAHRAREQEFLKLPSAAVAERYFDVLTAKPHHTGSPYQLELVDFVAERFKEFGMETTRHEYQVLIPWPEERSVEIVAPDRLTLHVDEEVLRDDPFAAQPGMLPGYNAYSPSGDVEGELVYVNYGVPDDYATLERLGIDVKGKIVLARYGGSWRGIKPKVAAEHGAVGCLIYSDPRDDGYFQGEPYPAGPFRGWGMVQRGSVMDMPRYPGDPLTPGRPSHADAERLPLPQVQTFAPIPVQPLSYRDGLELLRRLGGSVAPVAWRGALPVTYHIGPGPARVRVRLRMDFGQRRLVNVIGRFTGSVYPDEWVVAGGHLDAWVYGASDPVAGQVSLLNVARSFGELVRAGWRPKRTVVFASWDGEEAGLLGSTEWVEEFERDLREHAVVYVNRDAGASRGWFSSSAVHSLTPFVHGLARSVRDPEHPEKTLYDRWLERARDQNPPGEGKPPLAAPRVGALGSGSDYTAFLDHAGVSAIDLGISGEGGSGTYHSLYDHPLWFKKFMDPGFKYSVAASQVTGLAVMRVAEADALPFDYGVYGRQILEYVDEIILEARKATPTGAPAIDFEGLRQAAQTLAEAGVAARTEAEALLAKDDADGLRDLNRRLVQAERDLLEPQGLPDRPWYRHTIYAPGLYTGYGVKTIPGVREAVEAKNFTRAAAQAQLVVAALGRASRTLSGRP